MKLSKFRVIAVLCMAATFAAAALAQPDDPTWRDPYLTGDTALYPEPEPLETVPRTDDLRPDPSFAAIPVDTPPLAVGKNNAVRIALMKVVRGPVLAGTPAPDGMEAVILVTRWTNIRPRELVEKSKLEGKADRTYGAGGMFSGTGGGGAGGVETVEMDVPFNVPKVGQHAFLVAGGVATDMRVESVGLPNGIAAHEPLAIARFGESREVRLGYFVPSGSAHLVFRFFDYSNGHITLAVAGDQAQAMVPPDLAGKPDGTLAEVELAVDGLTFGDRYLDQAAPQGWRFARVAVLGRGVVETGRMGAIAIIDPTRSVWLAGDGGFVSWGLPPEDGGRSTSFTPEFFQRRVFAFLVPVDAGRFRLGVRGRGGAVSIAVTAEEPVPLQVGAVTHADGEVGEIAVLGLRWELEHLVADLGFLPRTGTQGIELNLARQFLLVDPTGTEISPDMQATRQLTRRPPEPTVIPPGTPTRFELAFGVPANLEPSILRYRGFGGEARLDLSGVAIAGTRGVATADGTTAFPEFAVAAAPLSAEAEPDRPARQASAASPSAVSAVPASRFGPPDTPPQLMPVALPDFDQTMAVAEVEPNNKLEEATALGKGSAATGTMSGKDEDWFLLQAEGEPQLWTFEASGPGARVLGLYRAGNARLVERSLVPEEASVRIDNVLLLPGPYWLKLRPTEAGGAYSVRAVALGRPDRYAEFEPNDKEDMAHILRFGEPRRGLIDHKDDRDLYRFSLNLPTHLVVSVTPPNGKHLHIGIESEGWRVSAKRAPESAQTVRYQALLEAGDYQVKLHADGGWRSDVPYEIRLDRLDPFALPADLEPNDREYEAQPIGHRRRFSGRVGAFGGADYYRLPPVAGKTALTVTLESDADIRPGLYSQDDDNIRSAPLEEDKKQRSDGLGVFHGSLEPGRQGLLYVRGTGDYRITLDYDPPLADGTVQSTDAVIDLALSSPTRAFNAYGKDTQEAPVTVSVGNRGRARQRILLETTSGETGWELALESDELDLAPGDSRMLSGVLQALPDRPAGQPIPVFVRAQDESGAGTTTALSVEAACDVPAVQPRRYEALPQSLRGGLNLAWLALGGEAVAENDSARRRFAELFDGMTTLNGRYDISGSKMPFDLTVRVGGAEPAEIAGVTLFPRAAGRDQNNLGPFEILASADGQAFSPVFAGHLGRSEVEHVFAFESPVRATHVRLRLDRAVQLNRNGSAGLGEWKVIAVPGSQPFGSREFNIASPALGGHIAWASWEAGYSSRVAMLTDESDVQKIRAQPLQPIEWVVGFHHGRAARITRLSWRDTAKVSKRDRRFESIKVSVSTGGPTGPWRPLADWTLERDGNGKSELVLPKPVWARFVRFAAPGSDQRADWLIPETLEIFEQPEDDGYLSVLGEWGHYARDAAFERSIATTTSGLKDDGGPGPDSATLLAVGAALGGRVQVGVDEDWFRVDVPDGMRRLEFAFDGAGAARLIPTLQNSAGETVALVEADELEGVRLFHAEVAQGESYLLRVREATRSIMIAWDNSGSVSAYHETMYRAIARFVDDIRPGLEVVNLLPFRDRDPVPLLENWTDDPIALKGAIGAYDRKDGSSESEKTLVGAMKALAERQGNRGIVFLTDANSGGDRIAASMWQLFHEVQPRVFAMELQLQARGVEHFQDLMQDWAAVNGGHYAVFRNQADLDVAFDRAACHMRRPADYRVALREGPGPGTLRVAWAEGKAMAGATIELIVDASGSMRSRKNKVDGKLKIDVAKDVMSEIIGLLPDDSQVGLRVYGHRKREGTKGDCEDSQLVVRIGDLDRKKLLAAVQKIKALGTTPIAYSLQQAGKDLARVEGPKLIVLVTDGKEECKADPATVVTELREQGIDVQLDIVGFALAEEKVKQDMQRAAEAGGGRFFDAQDRAALANAIRKTLAMPFEVLDSRSRQTAIGLTDQEAMSLYQGDYSVIVRTARGDVTVRDVPVKEGQATLVLLARDDNGMTVSIDGPRPAK